MDNIQDFGIYHNRAEEMYEENRWLSVPDRILLPVLPHRRKMHGTCPVNPKANVENLPVPQCHQGERGCESNPLTHGRNPQF